MWVYEQKTGNVYKDGVFYGKGYSGKGEGKNNPEMQGVSCTGPIPQGEYIISDAFRHTKKGVICMRLFPKKGNLMFGRSGFLIHGDSIKNPGTASEGCIILSKKMRLLISTSEDKRLMVTC